jgi:hypothetical protein
MKPSPLNSLATSPQKIVHLVAAWRKSLLGWLCLWDSNTSLSLAFTDPSIADPADQLKKINLCRSFFTAPSTRFVLPDSQHNENSPPFRDLTSSGWCNKKSTANFFATIGHTILHELTHLDTLGKQTGLQVEVDEDTGKDVSHGASDLTKDDEVRPAPCELAGARKYLTQYEADNTLGDPSYNAESHAAAATGESTYFHYLG